ncbi:unnamed protein product [Litomosoides sigmodontis]|uniref:Uncharacterized protein n=1 Tax=Litomosoides sigmodontis TaxID=42156 RepID=A0A3P6VEF7_LITSI|nr:unnamed protein product [Litomosoides sigmodontis]
MTIQFQIQTTSDELPWYKQVEPTMTLDKLLKLTEEFSRIYKTHGESLNIKKYAMRSSLREAVTPQNTNQPQQQSSQQSSQQLRQGQNQVAPSIATLPPPPVAPQLNASVTVKSTEPARRIDLSDYKLRNNAAQQQQQASSSQNSVAQSQRRNFMRPDVPPQTASKGLDLSLPPIIANEKQLNQNKPDQASAKPSEAKLAQMSKSTLKPATSQKPTITNAVKPLQPIKQPTGNEQERHKKPKLDDYDKDLKYRRIEKASTEGSYHCKRPYENNAAVNHPDSGLTITAMDVTSTPKSGTLKAAERHNPATPLSYMASSGYNITSKPREEVALQPPKREDNGTGSNNRSRDETIASRQRDDVISLKRARQTAPLIALLPTPPVSNTASVMSANSQNSKFNLSTVQPSRSNHIGERANAPTNWSVSNDYYPGSSSVSAPRFSQSTGSNHRHFSSNVGRTKPREPLLSTPDTGNSYYKRSRLRPPSPTTSLASNTYRQSQRQQSPGGRSGYSSSSTHMLSALPPPPLPPPNEELEDGEVL